MKAIRIHAFNGTDAMMMEDAPVPVPSANEVLIKVHASSINPVDVKTVEGKRQGEFPVSLPYIPGNDVSGRIENTGWQVKDWHIGDSVYCRADPAKNGSFAEFIVVDASRIAKVPTSMSLINSGSVPLSGLTAWQCLITNGKLKAGQKVLIHGGAGGVGSFAVQFAHAKGAYVIATAGTKDIDFVKQLGADEVVDYKKESFEKILHDIDLVVVLIGGKTQQQSISVLKRGGRLLSTNKIEFQSEAEEKGIYIAHFTTESSPEDLREIATLIDDGKVMPVIDSVFPLDRIKEAFEHSKTGDIRGKVVLQII